jgi:hypothetical protein
MMMLPYTVPNDFWRMRWIPSTLSYSRRPLTEGAGGFGMLLLRRDP